MASASTIGADSESDDAVMDAIWGSRAINKRMHGGSTCTSGDDGDEAVPMTPSKPAQKHRRASPPSRPQDIEARASGSLKACPGK